MNPYHSGTVSPRRGLTGAPSFTSVSSSLPSFNDKDTLPLPSSSKRKRHIRLPLGLNLTTSGGPLRRLPLAIWIFLAILLCVTFIPRTSTSITITPALNTPVRDDVQREVHAVNEEDTFAEDDLVVQNEVEVPARSEEEIKAQAEEEEKALATIEKDKVSQLRALVYWITRGGHFPDGWEVPSPAGFAEMGAEGFKRMLGKVHTAEEDEVFESGWEKEADTYNRVTVFSKSYCPHSGRAKAILEGYNIIPEAHVIELDQRDDTAEVQSVLQYLTGRRTVPNVLVEFTSIGGADEVTLLHHEGVLGRRVENNPHVKALMDAEGVIKPDE